MRNDHTCHDNGSGNVPRPTFAMSTLTDSATRTPARKTRLKPLDVDNIYQHFEWNNDPELNRLDSELPYEEESFGDFKRRFEQMVYHPQQHSQHFELHTEDDTLIGIAYIAGLNEHNRHATIGLTIGAREYWGEGYGRDALHALLAHCFEKMDLHRVQTEIFQYNDAWKQLVESLGFELEGTLRDYLYRDGQYWDKSIYAMLEDEYREQG